MTAKAFTIEDVKEELENLALSISLLIEKVATLYYAQGFIESVQKEERMKKEMKSPKKSKVGKVMQEYKKGKLHSGSKKGPVVKSKKQALAIGISEAKKGKK